MANALVKEHCDMDVDVYSCSIIYSLMAPSVVCKISLPFTDISYKMPMVSLSIKLLLSRR